ncbi:MAG: DUF935 family protein, partial [Alphaproteobacteria bacterium]|nr:DUF935 family protein [Alphaproteobacteria bacterium]
NTPQSGDPATSLSSPAAASRTGDPVLASLDYPTPGAVDQLDAADHLTSPALAQIQPIIDNWLNVIEENLTQSASLEEFRDNLAGLYPDLPDDALAAIMASAFTAAHVRGAAEIDDEATKAKAGQ